MVPNFLYLLSSTMHAYTLIYHCIVRIVEVFSYELGSVDDNVRIAREVKRQKRQSPFPVPDTPSTTTEQVFTNLKIQVCHSPLRCLPQI